MSFLLIPNEVANSEAVIWVGIINERINVSDLSVRYADTVIKLKKNWITYTTQSGRNSLIYQCIKIENLQSQTEYFFELFFGNQIFSTASVSTFPESLPTVNEKPFTVLLGSCFCSSRPGSATLGPTYLKLREREKIDCKILCGDQVYLDDPALHFLFNTHSFEDLEEILLANYVNTWTQGKGTTIATGRANPGYQQFLQNGANFFSSDDHEFWNNAPNRAALIRDSWSSEGRYNWLKIAKSLLEIFQSKTSKTIFNVGSLSFFIADTRINRTAGRISFMSSQDIEALDDWVTNLTGVGVLVVGQPIFSAKAGFLKGNLGDWNLSDYEQYKDLVKILTKTEHSLIVLTGDVHFGRVASCQLKPGVKIHEIISSPTALVDSKVGGSWEKAPDKFPAFSIPGIVSKPITTNLDYQFFENHFLLLSFYKDGAKTKLVLKACEIKEGGQLPMPFKIDEFTL